LANQYGSRLLETLAKLAVVAGVASRLNKRKAEGAETGKLDLPLAPRSGPPIPASPTSGLTSRRPRRSVRVNLVAGIAMLIAAGIAIGAATVLWPDSAGPPPGEPTIAGFNFTVDRPETNAVVRILVNPNGAVYGGAPGLMEVAVDLNVPRGQTVRWALEIDAASTAIRLRTISDTTRPPSRQRPGQLLAAPRPYQLPPPISKVRDYVVLGEIKGPSSGYTEATAAGSNLVNADTSLTEISWAGPTPAEFQGSYVTASMPSLTAYSTATNWNLGWRPASLLNFFAAEQLALPGDYQIDSGQQTSGGFMGWTWSSTGQAGLTNATGVGTSVGLQADTQLRSFWAGILLALAASALIAGLQFGVSALAEHEN
jgi:hypothetical protein